MELLWILMNGPFCKILPLPQLDAITTMEGHLLKVIIFPDCFNQQYFVMRIDYDMKNIMTVWRQNYLQKHVAVVEQKYSNRAKT